MIRFKFIRGKNPRFIERVLLIPEKLLSLFILDFFEYLLEHSRNIRNHVKLAVPNSDILVKYYICLSLCGNSLETHQVDTFASFTTRKKQTPDRPNVCVLAYFCSSPIERIARNLELLLPKSADRARLSLLLICLW